MSHQSGKFVTTANRRGVALLTAIVCLAVIAAICGSLIKVVHAQRQQTRLEERKLQAEWLAEAGLERAAAKLINSQDYSGEIWQIAATEFAGRGSVKISVEKIVDQPAKRLVRVQADYPADSDGRARQSKQATMTIVERKSGDES
jgi:Tfp pilus assembly protein PilX